MVKDEYRIQAFKNNGKGMERLFTIDRIFTSERDAQDFIKFISAYVCGVSFLIQCRALSDWCDWSN